MPTQFPGSRAVEGYRIDWGRFIGRMALSTVLFVVLSFILCILLLVFFQTLIVPLVSVVVTLLLFIVLWFASIGAWFCYVLYICSKMPRSWFKRMTTPVFIEAHQIRLGQYPGHRVISYNDLRDIACDARYITLSFTPPIKLLKLYFLDHRDEEAVLPFLKQQCLNARISNQVEIAKTEGAWNTNVPVRPAKIALNDDQGNQTPLQKAPMTQGHVHPLDDAQYVLTRSRMINVVIVLSSVVVFMLPFLAGWILCSGLLSEWALMLGLVQLGLIVFAIIWVALLIFLRHLPSKVVLTDRGLRILSVHGAVFAGPWEQVLEIEHGFMSIVFHCYIHASFWQRVSESGKSKADVPGSWQVTYIVRGLDPRDVQDFIGKMHQRMNQRNSE